MPSNYSFTNNSPCDLRVIPGSQAQTLSKKEKQLIKVLSKDQGASVTSAGIRTLIQAGEYKTLLNELKEQADSKAYALEAALGWRMCKRLRAIKTTS